jgi:cyclophilin family peptidyl-prolyl cis-trans isomerase/HEAT repeat protein
MKNGFLLLLLVSVICIATNTPTNKFSDPVLIKIADFQDHRNSDSLYAFFSSKKILYRKEAVLAFASIQDTLAIEKLNKVLKTDAEPAVRRSAAISLGQTSSKKSAAALREALSHEKNVSVLREIIEACGKTFSKQDISKIESSVSDPVIQEGIAWAYYRLGIRGIADSTITIKSTKFLAPDQTLQTRLAASNLFARGSQKTELAEKELIKSASEDKSPLVRANATSALRKVKTQGSREALIMIYKKDGDYRVRISAIRSLQPFSLADIKPTLIAALNDKNQNVSVAASEVIRTVAKKESAMELAALAKSATHWRVRGNLYEAALRDTIDSKIVSEILEIYKTEENPYGKAALLTALGQAPSSWEFINQQLQSSIVPVIKSSAAAALVSINENKKFPSAWKNDFANAYSKALYTGDPAVIGTIAGALMDSTLGYKKILTDYTFLYEAKKKLSLPKDNEALQPLEAAIAYFEGRKKADPVKNEFNHPIDWNLVKSIPKDQKVLIKTSKGDIVLRLLVEEAPGSVANFVQLVTSKYFDAKNFHRVVPNFVIQGGCNRGDGWGSEDYSIRSEFTDRHYTEGSVGMASAGKDTEGTQWFITHSPTPHLDGRYSIFAVTESGMDVVHQIEVGDKIQSVALIK